MPLSINAPHATVKTRNFGHTTDWSDRTVYLAAGITAADIGKAVQIDPAAPNTFKLTTENSRIDGRLEVVEARSIEGTLVGTVKTFLQGVELPLKAGETIAPGDYICGAANGEVKEATQATDPKLYVATETRVVGAANKVTVHKA
jgi:hypothetical protein